MVITYSIKPNIYAGLVCGKRGIPFFSNVQGLGTAFQRKGLAWFVTLLYKTAFRKVETVFFENEGNAEEFQRRHIIPAEKQKVLRGAGINLEHHVYQEYPENDPIRFLYLGRIMKEKGMDELVEAVRILRDENISFVLDLVGFFEDEYKEAVESLQVEGLAVFHGFQEDPRPFYGQADCVVLPSYHEGMSNVLLEAAAAGRPVITSDIYGCRETVEPDVTGYLCRVKDGESLYQQMKRMAQLSREDRKGMGIAARQKMEREFEKSVVVAQTIEVITRDSKCRAMQEM